MATNPKISELPKPNQHRPPPPTNATLADGGGGGHILSVIVEFEFANLQLSCHIST